MATGKTEKVLHNLLAAEGALMNQIQKTLMLRFAIGLFEQLRKSHDGGKRIVEFVRHARDKFTNAGKLLALDQLRLGGFEAVDSLFEFLPRRVQVLRHTIEHGGQLAAFVT